MPYNLRIPGRFTERELWAIEAMAKSVPPGGVVVEVGSYLGLSSYAWAKSVDPSVTVYCIDAWEEDGEYAQKWQEKYQIDYSLEKFHEFTQTCSNIVVLKGFSHHIFTDWDKSIDVYFQNIDRQHTVIGENISLWSQFVKVDGLICGYGYGGEFPCVIDEVRKLANLYGVEPVIVEKIWCLTTGVSVNKLNTITKINDIHGYEYELNLFEPPALLEPGDLLKVSGKLKNISGRDWDIFVGDREIIKIGIQVYEENKPGRQEFRRSLGVDKFVDGATIEFECLIETKPLKQGKIRLVFDLVAEGRYWFEDKGAKPETIIVQVLPRTAGNLIKVGNQLKREGKLIEAIAEYRRAIELNPDFSWVYFNLGDALAKRGYINEAIAEYRRAIKLNPNSACFNYQLGELLALQKHDDQALYYLQKGVEIKYFDRFDTVLRKILAKQKNKIYPLHNICLYLNDLELERIQKIKKFKPSKDFIFITARYRTGSTYLYSLFSSLHDVLAFYEPLNPDLIYWLDQDASSTKEGKILQNHTFKGNYFEEYKLLERKTLIKNYSESFANSRMTMLSVENFNQLKNYMQFLLSSQVGLNKLKVLQFNRIDFRLSWFKFNFPNALIINLRRKSRDIYASYIGVYERLNKTNYEPLKTDLGNFFYLDDYIEFLGNISIPRFNKNELNNYEKIYLVNQLSNLWANKFADLVINYESLVDDPIETLSKIVSYIPNFELNFKENIIEPKKDRVNVGQDYHSEDWFKQCEERCDRLIAEILSFGKIYNNQDGEYAISQKLV